MSNFLGEVLQAKGTASFEDLYDTIKSLDGRIAQLKSGVVQSLHTTFVLYDTDLDRVIQWYTEILEIQQQLEALEFQLSEDKQVICSANQNLDLITSELNENQESIRLLMSLVGIVKNFERADPLDYFRASECIKEAENELSMISTFFPTADDQQWIKQLRARFSDLVVDVYDRCRKEWNNLFKFDKHSLSIFPQLGDTAQLIRSLKNIKSFQRIWDKFTELLWQELFKPALSRDYKIEVQNGPGLRNIPQEVDEIPTRDIDTELSFLNTSTEDNIRSAVVIKAKKLDKPYNNASVLFDNITVLVKVLRDVFARSPEEMNELSRSIAPKIDHELANKYLKTLILERCGGDINIAREDLASMGSFKTNLQENYNFVFPEGNVFEKIETNFEDLFETHVRTALIVKIRDLIKADVQDTVVINHEGNSTMSHDEIVLLRKNPALFPKCTISQSIADIVQLLQAHMRQDPTDVEMCASTFSLYLAFVKIPKHESDAGAMIPLRAVLIHNNSLFLAHHAGFTFDICDDMVPDLRAKASQAIAFMMRSIRSCLNELITTAMSSIQERVDRNIDITHDFLVLTAELKRLNGVIGAVLPAITWHDILATLVDHSVNEICLKILAWEDISANCASELASALTQFSTATSSLFRGDAETPREIEALTARAVRKWQRFKLAIFILTASMKEIESKWVGGCGPLANEFTPEEVRRLVRALFQNTDRRAAFLATIK